MNIVYGFGVDFEDLGIDLGGIQTKEKFEHIKDMFSDCETLEVEKASESKVFVLVKESLPWKMPKKLVGLSRREAVLLIAKEIANATGNSVEDVQSVLGTIRYEIPFR